MREHREPPDYFWVCEICRRQADIDIPEQSEEEEMGEGEGLGQCNACLRRSFFDRGEIHAVRPPVFAAVIHRLYGF